MNAATIGQARSFADLLARLRAGKMTTATMTVLLGDAAVHLAELLAVADWQDARIIELELADCEIVDDEAECPGPGCEAEGCGQVSDRIAAEFPPAEPLPACPLPPYVPPFGRICGERAGGLHCNAAPDHGPLDHAAYDHGKLTRRWPVSPTPGVIGMHVVRFDATLPPAWGEIRDSRPGERVLVGWADLRETVEHLDDLRPWPLAAPRPAGMPDLPPAHAGEGSPCDDVLEDEADGSFWCTASLGHPRTFHVSHGPGGNVVRYWPARALAAVPDADGGT